MVGRLQRVGALQPAFREMDEKRRQVFQPLGHEMLHAMIALDAAGNADEARAEHDGAEALEHGLPDHDIGDARFVLHRE